MIFGTLFFADVVLQVISARIVQFRRWRLAISGGVFEIVVAFIFYLPYPVRYAGTIPYCVSLGLIFGGWKMILPSSTNKSLDLCDGQNGAYSFTCSESSERFRNCVSCNAPAASSTG
jgi:hypothetical protein